MIDEGFQNFITFVNSAHYDAFTKRIQQFIDEGYVKIENAFSKTFATEARTILWQDMPCKPDQPATWTQPVIRLGNYSKEPFLLAANTPIPYDAFDQLVGKGKWLPCRSVGTFPVRFPRDVDPGDIGWHADAGFYGDDGSMRLNIRSKGRALLMLFIFSDIGAEDAPTKILSGSHLDVPALLAPAGDKGLTFIELSQKLSTTLSRKEVSATGDAGTVYLCHPFLIHSAQPNRGKQPRFLAQPPLLPAKDDFINIAKIVEHSSPVELAIKMGL